MTWAMVLKSPGSSNLMSRLSDGALRNSAAWDCITLSVIGIACMSLIDRCANSGTSSGSVLTTSPVIVAGGGGAGRFSIARLSADVSAVDSSAAESSCSMTLRQICAIFFAERFRIV